MPHAVEYEMNCLLLFKCCCCLPGDDLLCYLFVSVCLGSRPVDNMLLDMHSIDGFTIPPQLLGFLHLVHSFLIW